MIFAPGAFLFIFFTLVVLEMGQPGEAAPLWPRSEAPLSFAWMLNCLVNARTALSGALPFRKSWGILQAAEIC